MKPFPGEMIWGFAASDRYHDRSYREQAETLLEAVIPGLLAWGNDRFSVCLCVGGGGVVTPPSSALPGLKRRPGARGSEEGRVMTEGQGKGQAAAVQSFGVKEDRPGGES